MKPLLWIGFVILCFSARLHAFEIKEVQVGSSLRFLKWNTAKGPVRVQLNPAGSADLPIAVVETALKGAMNAWQNVPSQSLRFEYAGKSASAVASDTDLRNSVFWIENNWPYSSSVMAVTRYSYFLSEPPELADADILVNGQSYKWSNSPSAGANPQRVLTHELGHLMGLSHSSVAGSTMYPSSTTAKPPSALSPDERAAMQFLYGTPIPDFRLITPVPGAVYTERMAEKGLPLPVFRWTNAAAVSYDVEFSNTASFGKKLKFPVGAKNSFLLSAGQEQQLLNLSPQKIVYWRVNTGAAQTPSRALRFRPYSAPVQTAAADVNINGETQRILLFSFVSFVLILTAMFVFRHLRATRLKV